MRRAQERLAHDGSAVRSEQSGSNGSYRCGRSKNDVASLPKKRGTVPIESLQLCSAAWNGPSINLRPNNFLFWPTSTISEPEQLFRSIYPKFLRRDPPDETTLFSPKSGPLPGPYKWGIIGKHDRTLEPLIRTGSIVQIDTRRREITPRKEWARELQRPIYFLRAGGAYFCGWCEFDPLGEILTLVPHPLSPASSRRWKYRKEIETIGRVVAVVVRSTPSR